MTRDISLDDFMAGLLTALVGRGVSSISIRGNTFYDAVESAYLCLEGIADTLGLNLRFMVKTDPIHGDSQAVREAVSQAVLCDLARLGDPECHHLRFRVNRDEAAQVLAELPGGPEPYRRATDDFLAHYP